MARTAQNTAKTTAIGRAPSGIPGGAVPRTVSRAALMPDGTDRAFRQFVHRLLAFSARLEAVRDRFGAILGLSGIQYSALISIAHLSRDKAIGVKEVAEHLGLSGSFATLVIGQLTQRGLVEKQANQGDRRRLRLTVTDKGLALLRQLAPVQRRVNDVLFEPLAADQFRLLNDVFGELMGSGVAAVNLVEYLAEGGPAAVAAEAGTGGQP